MRNIKPLSQNAIGRALGVSSACMVKWKRQGCPTDSIDSVRAWRKAKQNIAARKPEPVAVVDRSAAPPASKQSIGGNVLRNMALGQDARLDAMAVTEDLDEARTRLMTADANLAEIKLSDLRGKYLERAKVDSTAFEISRALRDNLMNCARRIAADVAGLTTADECETVIEREHRALLENMSHSLANKLGATT